MSSKQVFVLGVGGQKAGSSWVWSYLRKMETVSFPRPKEFHIFDAMLRPDLEGRYALRHEVEHLSRGRKQKLKEFMGLRNKEWLSTSDRVEMIKNPQLYVDFFKNYDPSAYAVGETTPCYSILTAKNFRFIKELLEPHFDLRVILLLRDPVKRAFSASRHFRRMNEKAFPVAFDDSDDANFETLMDSPFILERQNYERLLKGLDEVFAPGQVHIEFYERLFTAQAVGAITDFLGLPAREADFGQRINAAPTKSAMSPELAARARDVYAPTYDYCRERFGADLIDNLWTKAG